MNTEIEFLDELPYASRRGGGRIHDPRIAEFADALRANPGKWAKYPNQLGRRTAYSYVSRINNPAAASPRMPAPFRSGEFEAKVRAETLYVRAKA